MTTSLGKPFFNTLVPGMNTNWPVERGSLAVMTRNDLVRNMWGVPTALERNLKVPQYLQPMDMLGSYKDRAYPIQSQLITAAMMNSRASFLTTVAVPIFLTSEVNFVSKQREINQVGFSNIQDHGIPHQQTTREITWSTTLEKYSFTFPISLNLAIDENYGSQEWLFQLAGFAANAQLTIMKESAYGLTKLAYENLVSNFVKNIPFDLSQLLRREAESFCIAAFDQDAFFDMIRRFEDIVPGANMVILPKGGARYLSELKGESTSMIVQKIQTNPQTGELMVQLDEMGGPPSVKTIKIGPRYYNFVELQNFRVNEEDDRVEQPLKTCVTIAQFYPPDPDNDWCQMTPACEDANDVYIYWQTATQGDQIRVQYIEALKSSFYWNYHDGKFSQHIQKLRDDKNRSLDVNKPVDDGLYLDIPGDHDQPFETGDILGKTDLRAMKRFRHHYVGLTWDRRTQQWRIPEHIGDYHIRHMPNEAIENVAETFHSDLARSIGRGSADSFMNEFYDLMDDISSTVPTEEFLTALQEANAEFTRDRNNNVSGSTTPQNRPAFPNVSRLQEWVPNKFGALNLPRKDGRIRMTYPAGFDSGPGLMTLAKEADNELSEWRDVGLRAKKILAFIEAFIRSTRQYSPNSSMINPKNTMPWFHVESDVAAVVDQLRPYKTPLFLALPMVKSSSLGEQDQPEIISIQPKSKTVMGEEGLKHPNMAQKAMLSLDNKTDVRQRLVQAYNDLEANDDESKAIFEKLFLYIIRETEYSKEEPSNGANIVTATIVTDHFITNYVKRNPTTSKNYISDKKGATKFINDMSTDGNTKKNALSKIIEGNSERENWSKKEYSDMAQNDKIRGKQSYENYIRQRGETSGKTYEQLRKEVSTADQERSRSIQGGTSVNDADKAYEEKLEKIFGGSERARAFGKTKDDHRSIVLNDGAVYLRAPLMSSEGALQYILNSPGKPLILIADPQDAYESPIMNYGEKSYKDDYMKFQSHNSSSDLFHSLTHSPFAYGIQQSLKSSINSSPKGSFTSDDSDDYQYKHESDKIFGVRSQKSSSSSFKGGVNMRDYVSFGRDYDIDERRESSGGFGVTGTGGVSSKGILASLQRKFFGPWDQRFEYMRGISSPTTKGFFKAILMATNSLDTFIGANKAGKKLINVMLVRPFIQQIVSSVIVMEAGANTAVQAVGHPWLSVTKEDRGIIHTRCDFRTGIVPVTKKNVQMIPYCIPERFIGGMKVDFMRDHKDFVKPNPEKPSLISMLIPITERKFEGPIHLLNLNPYYRPDLQNYHLRKWSAAEMFRTVFGEDVTMRIEGYHMNRINYGTPVVGASLVAHRGPTGYRDFTSPSHKIRYIDGNGPRGDIRMNWDRAWNTHNGGSHKFTDYRAHLM